METQKIENPDNGLARSFVAGRTSSSDVRVQNRGLVFVYVPGVSPGLLRVCRVFSRGIVAYLEEADGQRPEFVEARSVSGVIQAGSFLRRYGFTATFTEARRRVTNTGPVLFYTFRFEDMDSFPRELLEVPGFGRLLE
jgi:hypothetical protein